MFDWIYVLSQVLFVICVGGVESRFGLTFNMYEIRLEYGNQEYKYNNKISCLYDIYNI